MSASTRRMPFVDTLKAIASQLIVLHHLAFYGPMSDIAYPLAAGSIDWLYEYGRMAVQVFLVVAGYLAARSLAPAGVPADIAPIRQIWARYCRLALPLFAALLLSIASAAIARQLMEHPSISAAPTTWQVLSHILLLQNLLDHEALSAGVWYVAIDFQLFAMLIASLWFAGKRSNPAFMAPFLVTVLAAAALLHFNRQDSWDNWGLYFFGSYALGIAAAWGGQRQRATGWSLLILSLTVIALILDFRLRIGIALVTALLLAVSGHQKLNARWPDFRLMAWLGRISYSLFLIHFPVCMLVNALMFHFAPHSPALNLMGMGLAWLLSIGAGALFYYGVEARIGRLLAGASRSTTKQTGTA